MSGNTNDASSVVTGVEGLRISESSFEAEDRIATNGDEENLCKRCQNLDIKGILENYQKAKDNPFGGYIVKRLGSLKSMKRSECPLCKFFSKMVLEHQTEATSFSRGGLGDTFPSFETQNIQLVAVTVGHAYLHQWRSRRGGRPDVSGLQKQVMLGLAPMDGSRKSFKRRSWEDFWNTAHHCWYRIGMIAALTSSGNNIGWNLQTRQISSKEISYDILTTWLDTCRNNHEECAATSLHEAPCAKVIDCKTGEIVKPPQKCQYLALSYVWGPTQVHLPGPGWRANGKSTVLAMPESVPLTVSDAMEVVCRLGYQYLWVDKYCIDQENTIERDSQIKLMDKIYVCCTLVIVAAAGKDSSFGLPGVSTTPRESQPTITTKGITLRSTLPNPVYTISRSTWMTRGWTYQEAIFSPRHLYFTEHQVVYACLHSKGSATFCSEVFGHPPNVQVVQYQFEDRVIRSPGFEITDDNDETFLLRLRITQHISGFSSRDLTFDGDALNACQGILQRLQRLNPSIPHFYGLPIQDAAVSLDGPGSDDSSDGSGSDDSSDGSGSDDSSDGPGSDDSSDGPESDDSSNGSGSDDSSDGPESDDSSDGSGSDDSSDGPGSDDSLDGSGSDDLLDGSGSDGVVHAKYKPRYLGANGVLASALYWYHTTVSTMEIKRRSQFPTWTWLGWTKEVYWSDALPFDETNDIEIAVEDNEKRLWPWDTWESAWEIIRIQESMTGRLRIAGWLIQVKIQNFHYDYGHRFFVSREDYKSAVELHVSASAPTECHASTLLSGDNTMDSGNKLDSSNFYGELLDETKTWEVLSLGPSEPLMLLKDEGNGQFSRWGMTERPELNRNKSASDGRSHQRWAELWLI